MQNIHRELPKRVFLIWLLAWLTSSTSAFALSLSGDFRKGCGSLTKPGATERDVVHFEPQSETTGRAYIYSLYYLENPCLQAVEVRYLSGSSWNYEIQSAVDDQTVVVKLSFIDGSLQQPDFYYDMVQIKGTSLKFGKASGAKTAEEALAAGLSDGVYEEINPSEVKKLAAGQYSGAWAGPVEWTYKKSPSNPSRYDLEEAKDGINLSLLNGADFMNSTRIVSSWRAPAAFVLVDDTHVREIDKDKPDGIYAVARLAPNSFYIAPAEVDAVTRERNVRSYIAQIRGEIGFMAGFASVFEVPVSSYSDRKSGLSCDLTSNGDKMVCRGSARSEFRVIAH